MPTDGNTAFGERLDRGKGPSAAFEFHHLSTCLHEPDGVSHSKIYRYLITSEGHIGDEPRPTIAPRNARRVIGHILGGYRQGRRVPLEHHPERVADEKHVHARVI